MKAPWFLRRCRCRSYHRRTGAHVAGCPRRTYTRARLGRWLRSLADRTDPSGAPRFTGLTFGFVKREGLVVEWGGPGCKLWYLGGDDHDNAWRDDVGGVVVKP